MTRNSDAGGRPYIPVFRNKEIIESFGYYAIILHS